jgi:hypothetical protein
VTGRGFGWALSWSVAIHAAGLIGFVPVGRSVPPTSNPTPVE